MAADQVVDRAPRRGGTLGRPMSAATAGNSGKVEGRSLITLLPRSVPLAVLALLVVSVSPAAANSIRPLPPLSVRGSPAWLTVTTGPTDASGREAPQLFAITSTSHADALIPFDVVGGLRRLDGGSALVWAMTISLGRTPIRVQSRSLAAAPDRLPSRPIATRLIMRNPAFLHRSGVSHRTYERIRCCPRCCPRDQMPQASSCTRSRVTAASTSGARSSESIETSSARASFTTVRTRGLPPASSRITVADQSAFMFPNWFVP